MICIGTLLTGSFGLADASQHITGVIMKYTHLLVGLFAIIFLSACSSTTSSVAESDGADTTTTKPAAEAVAAADSKGDGYRCERVAVTGTRFKQKYCTTQQQRDDRAASAATAAQRLSIKNTQAGGPASN